MIDYRPLREKRIAPALFAAFIRRQVVTDCLRPGEDGAWRAVSAPFIDDWSAQDIALLCRLLRETARAGGLVLGAFDPAGALKGVASVEAQPIGPRGEYLDLSCIHVSQDMRARGVGRELFARAKAFARSRGAEKLYISAHSAVESQAFYAAMGCVDAAYIHEEHALREPFDRQLECAL